ncbi:MAG: hypothetical protein AAF587_31240 [Bacteroidota bacterium]
MLLKLIRLRLIYGRDFFLYALAVNGISYYVFDLWSMSSIALLIWFKLLASVAGLYFHQRRKVHLIFFFMNNGLGKFSLLLSTAIIDLGIWLFGFYLFFY